MGMIPAEQPLKIIDRAGVDINPLNPVARLDYLRLLSYTWADQSDRLDRIKQIAPHQTTQVEKADAADWLPNRLNAQPLAHYILCSTQSHCNISHKRVTTKSHRRLRRRGNAQHLRDPWDIFRWKFQMILKAQS